MQFENVGGGEWICGRPKTDCGAHGLDVPHDFSGQGPRVTWIEERLGKFAMADVGCPRSGSTRAIPTAAAEGNCLHDGWFDRVEVGIECDESPLGLDDLAEMVEGTAIDKLATGLGRRLECGRHPAIPSPVTMVTAVARDGHIQRSMHSRLGDPVVDHRAHQRHHQ